MNTALYNITNDKLFAKFDERLSKEDYQAARHAGFVWWPGSKQFVAKWSTQAEDYLRGKGIETIGEDDTPDNVEARVERFEKYAGEAEKSATSAENYLNSERANTERRRENAVNAIEKNLSAAEHWNRRIESAIRHAARKERPDVIARRIEELEKDKRRHIANSTPDPRVDGARYGCADSVWCGPRTGRGGFWLKKSELPAAQDHAKRWIEHIDKRLLYERAMLEAAGGIVGGTGAAPMDHEKFQIGGAVKTRRQDWQIITKVNKRTVEVFNPGCHWRNYWKVDRTEITEVVSVEEVNNAPENSELWHVKRRKAAKLAEIAEVMRAEKDHMPELEKICAEKGWGKYAHQGDDSKKQIVYMFLSAQKAA